jgi:transposase
LELGCRPDEDPGPRLACPLAGRRRRRLPEPRADGPAPRLSDAQLAQVGQALLKGATVHGFFGELWTLDRIAMVIERVTGVRHPLGWSIQRPKRRAAERNQAAD